MNSIRAGLGELNPLEGLKAIKSKPIKIVFLKKI
jgi:hypothetical protein